MLLNSLAVQKVETVQGHRKITSRGCPYRRGQGWCSSEHGHRKRQKEGEKRAQNQIQGGRPSGSSWRHGRQTTYGNNIAGDGNKMLCCLTEGKEHRGERWGRH